MLVITRCSGSAMLAGVLQLALALIWSGLVITPGYAQRCSACAQQPTTQPCNCCPVAPLPPGIPMPAIPQDSYSAPSITYGGPISIPGATSGDIVGQTIPSTREPGQKTTFSDNSLNMSQDLTQVNPNDFQDVASPSVTAGQFASAFGGGAGAAGVPSMIGDFFGAGYQYAFITGTPGPANAGGTTGTTVATAGGDRQFKYAENTSPIPQDRFFFNYNHFHNAVQDTTGADQNVNRYTFGLEKTFLDGWGSFEIRTPFADTVSASPDVFSDDPTGVEFGNIAMALKGILVRDSSTVVSVGLGMLLPTGADYEVGGDGVIGNVFRNESFHLQPFLGVYNRPSSRTFSLFFAQLDIDTSGSDLTIGTTTDNLKSQSLLMLDYSRGYWITQNRCGGLFQGLAAMAEVHYTTTLEDQDYGSFAGVSPFGATAGGTTFVEDARRDVLNITGGLLFQITPMSSLKVAAVAPLRTTGSDKLFDAEFGLQFVRRF